MLSSATLGTAGSVSACCQKPTIRVGRTRVWCTSGTVATSDNSQGPSRLCQTLHRRQSLVLLSTLAFLPVRGCDQGGYYATGAGGHPSTHTCEPFATSPQTLGSCPCAGVKGTPGLDCQQLYQPAATAEAQFKKQTPPVSPVPSLDGQTQRQTLPDLPQMRAKAVRRQQLDKDRVNRTQSLVDSTWQSLE